jgi:pimeloyl-ACP methyl ester carboxylesterase
MRARPLLPALAAAVAGVALAAPAAHADIPFAPCTPLGFQCAHLAVPLDRSGAVPGQLTLAIKRVPASSNPDRAAVVGLAGGPGQAALPLATDFAKSLAPALTSRDLLLFDQRGTGSSGNLQCTALETRGSTLARVGSCAAQLGPSRAFYRTTDSVEDLEAIRVAAGYDKLVLYGVSYGTKVALAYAARYPAHVQSLVLDSVVPPDGPDVLHRSSFAAMRRVMSELCGDGACRRITTTPLADLATVARRLEAHPLRGPVISGSGRALDATMDNVDLFGLLLAGDLDPPLRAELPGALRSALHGDAAPLLRDFAHAAGLNGIAQQTAAAQDSDAVFLATRCEESTFPWDRAASAETRLQQASAAVRGLPASVFAPFDREVAFLGEAITVCAGWPNAAPPPDPPGALPAVPTLVLDGEADLRTPVEDARRVAAQIPGAQVVTVPHTGHSVLGSDLSTCAQDAVKAFFAGIAPGGCSPTPNLFSPTRVAPTSLARVSGNGRVGKTVEALRETVGDVMRQFIGDAIAAGRATTVGSHTGGLRAGHATWIGDGAASLQRVVYVPGVVVSGHVSSKGTSTFTLTGDRGARGRVAITSHGLVTGHLDGRRVHLQLAGASAAALSAPRLFAAPRLPRFPRLARIR